MTQYIYYQLTDGSLVNKRPDENEVEFATWAKIHARDGYVLQHILTNQFADELFLPIGCVGFWREVLLDEKK